MDKKFTMFFIQLTIQNAHILYQRYGSDPNKHKKSLRMFYEDIYRSLIHFKEEDWPKNSKYVISHAPSLPQEMQRPSPRKQESQSRETTTDTPLPMPMHRLSPRKNDPSAAPNNIPKTVGIIMADAPTKKQKMRRVDPPNRLVHNANIFHQLIPTPLHEEGPKKGKSKQLECQVHSRQGIRKETTSQCAVCLMPLCQSKTATDCFYKYHKYTRYWEH